MNEMSIIFYGSLNQVFHCFNIDIPTQCPDVPSEILDPKTTWVDKDSYDLSAKKLAQMFVYNFKKLNDVAPEIQKAGPNVS